MSRTDVHTPYWVKLRDPAWRFYFTEYHDHRDGVCDLAVFLAARRWLRTRCTVELAWRRRNIHCGCRLCTGQPGRKAARRAERTRWRATRARLLAGDTME